MEGKGKLLIGFVLGAAAAVLVLKYAKHFNKKPQGSALTETTAEPLQPDKK